MTSQAETVPNASLNETTFVRSAGIGGEWHRQACRKTTNLFGFYKAIVKDSINDWPVYANIGVCCATATENEVLRFTLSLSTWQDALPYPEGHADVLALFDKAIEAAS